jgi:hypothetical protein
MSASKITQLGVLRSTHSSKTKSKQVKNNNYKGTFFCIFDKKMQAKIK